MNVPFLVSIFIWVILGIGALISDHKAIVGTGALFASFVYLANVSHENNDLMALIAVFLLWLSLSLLTLVYSLRGVSRNEVESVCSFASLGYLPLLMVLFFKYGAMSLAGIFLWFGMWYGFRRICHQEKVMIIFVCLPAVLLAVLFHTFLAVSYGILLWWLYREVKRLLNMSESIRNAETT